MVTPVKESKEVSDDESKDLDNISEKKQAKNESSATEEKKDSIKPKDIDSPRSGSNVGKQEEEEQNNKEPLGDVWIFDTFLSKWFQIKPQLLI